MGAEDKALNYHLRYSAAQQALQQMMEGVSSVCTQFYLVVPRNVLNSGGFTCARGEDAHKSFPVLAIPLVVPATPTRNHLVKRSLSFPPRPGGGMKSVAKR